MPGPLQHEGERGLWEHTGQEPLVPAGPALRPAAPTGGTGGLSSPELPGLGGFPLPSKDRQTDRASPSTFIDTAGPPAPLRPRTLPGVPGQSGPWGGPGPHRGAEPRASGPSWVEPPELESGTGRRAESCPPGSGGAGPSAGTRRGGTARAAPRRGSGPGAAESLPGPRSEHRPGTPDTDTDTDWRRMFIGRAGSRPRPVPGAAVTRGTSTPGGTWGSAAAPAASSAT